MPARSPSRLTYANVMATFAVFLALGGGAYADLSLPKNSVGNQQLKNGAVSHRKLEPRSVSGRNVKEKTLNGRNINLSTLGQTPSAALATDAGELGEIAAVHYFRSGATLQPGDTETGEWGGGVHAGGGGATFDHYAYGSFPIRLAHTLDSTHAIVVTGTAAPHCAGPGHADSGYLCVYVQDELNVSAVTGPFDSESASGAAGSGLYGFEMATEPAGAGTQLAAGSFAVTG